MVWREEEFVYHIIYSIYFIIFIFQAQLSYLYTLHAAIHDYDS